jgi:phospholipid-translocating ATPase
VIYERSAKGQDKLKESTSVHLDLFANQGLRTLVLAYKELSEEEYKQWADEYMAASSSLENREAKMDAVASQVEKDLILLGATAIEDRLQEGVPECIARLAKAGIKLWVLTGDKTETAINIGFSCRLLTKEMMLIVIKASDFDSTRSQIASVMKKCFDLSPDGVPAHLVKEEEVNFYEDSMNRPNNRGTLDFKNSEFALIIDGTSLKFALDKRISPSFLNLATRCKAVVCCRVSPLQKAQVVSLVKNSRNVMSLAIGDGANG